MIQPHLVAEPYADTDGCVARGVAGLTHANSLVQAAPGLTCLNWVVGDLMASCSNMLAILGELSVWGWAEAKRYIPGSEPITGPDYALTSAGSLPT